MAQAPPPSSEALVDALDTPLGTPSQTIPLPETDPFLEPPRASYLSPAASVSYAAPSENNSTSVLPTHAAQDEKLISDEPSPQASKKVHRSWLTLGIAAAVVVVVVCLAVILPVYFTVIKPRQHKNNLSTSGSSAPGSNPAGSGPIGGGSDNPSSPTGATSGGDGSKVVAVDGSTFTYTNPFGGFWVFDPDAPFNNDAQPNSWTPPLNSSWDYSKNKINGVNLGGWFVIEPFIAPALFQKYPDAIDEWTLSQAMAADAASGGLNQLEDHYNTFITEQDFAQIAGAGLNWVRLPVPFWMIETWPGEPFLAKTSWKYILRAIGWARKYGLRVNIDLHTAPGSQNGFNHSGKDGQVNFMNGVMGLANAQRMLEYIRVVTEFFTQPQYQDVVPMFGIINEALVSSIGKSQMTSFYLQAHNMIRSITGLGAGNGPYISIHDGFTGISNWANFLPGSDRIILDTHPYFAFDGQPNTEPIATSTNDATAGGSWPKNACHRWADGMNQSRTDFGVTVAGEFSAGFNDCGLFLNGVGGGSSYGGNCNDWQDSSNWNASVIAGIKALVMAEMDTFGDYFFWTWKIANSSTNIVESPLWSYKLGLEQGWVPSDPRTAIGKCASLGEAGTPFNGEFQPWQTGGAGAGTITGSDAWPWPPATISNVAGGDGDATSLPLYTYSGSIVSLPPQTLTAAVGGSTPTGVDVGSGWFDSQDTASAPTPISGCTYPDPWTAQNSPIPVPNCATGVVLPTSFVLTTPSATATPR